MKAKEIRNEVNLKFAEYFERKGFRKCSKMGGFYTKRLDENFTVGVFPRWMWKLNYQVEFDFTVLYSPIEKLIDELAGTELRQTDFRIRVNPWTVLFTNINFPAGFDIETKFDDKIGDLITVFTKARIFEPDMPPEIVQHRSAVLLQTIDQYSMEWIEQDWTLESVIAQLEYEDWGTPRLAVGYYLSGKYSNALKAISSRRPEDFGKPQFYNHPFYAKLEKACLDSMQSNVTATEQHSTRIVLPRNK